MSSIVKIDRQYESPRRNISRDGDCRWPVTHTPPSCFLTKVVLLYHPHLSYNRENRFKKQFLDNGPSIEGKSLYNPRQVEVLVEVVERLLFVSATSIEEYSNTSTLEDRFLYVVTRFLQKKLQARAEHNRRKEFLASALLAKKKQSSTFTSSLSSYKELNTVNLAEIHRSFQRLNIRSNRTMAPASTSTRSKVSMLRRGIRERKF